ncbi:MAG: EAL domain-containing protein, partial [Acidobacteriota bacterium]
ATSLSVQETLQRLFGGEEFRSMTPGPAVRIGSAIVREYPFFRLERQIYRGVEEARVNASRADVPDRERWQTELKRIIRDRAIETLFQPLVDLDRGSIIGYEAFSRGPHASDFEMPDHLFERSRQIGMSGELDRICQRAALKKARGLGSQDKLFINALPDSLSDPCFREALLAGLPEDFPVCRNNIVLEIADRHMVRDCEAFSTEVNDLRAQGFRMSIDDVGKSSTSLESLTELRPDFIKVDGSLIRNIHKNLIKQELVRSLCHAAGTMNAQIIAEGIETREELSVARQCGARIGQGYFFYRPSREIPVRRIKRDRAGM